MAGTRSAGNGRLAAVAAADRIKLLLEIVHEDDFLHEILSNAHRTVQGGMAGQSSVPSGFGGHAPRRGSIPTASVLGHNYHEAKKKSLEGLRLDRVLIN